MMPAVSALVQFVGIALILIGCARISTELALIVGGALVVALGIVIDGPKKADPL